MNHFCKLFGLFFFAFIVLLASCAFNIDTDVTPPSITATTPTADATDVPTNTKVTAVFSEALDSSTLGAASFTLRASDVFVAGTVSCLGSIAEFSPSADLEAFTTYTATIAGTTADEAGNELGADGVWSFTTGATTDTIAPTIVSRSPESGAVNVVLSAAVIVTFSEAIDPTTVTATSFSLVAGATPAAGSFGYDGANITLIPSSNLTAATTYTVTLTSGIRDMSGNPLAAQATWSFTTVAIPTIGAAGLSFQDQDVSLDQIQGALNIARAANEADVASYNVYWGSNASTKLGGQPVIAVVTKTGSDLIHAFSANTGIPAGASHFLVYACNPHGEIAVPASLAIPDLEMSRVSDIYSSTGEAEPEYLIAYNGSMYFRATSDGSSYEPWTYDGQTSPSRLSDQYTDSYEFFVFNGLLYFRGIDTNGDILSVFDGNTAGPVFTVDPLDGGSGPNSFCEYMGHLFYCATDAILGNELFEYDPSDDSVTIHNIVSGIGSSGPSGLFVFNNELFFTAEDTTDNRELWSYDGIASPNLVADIEPTGSSYPAGLTEYSGRLYFSASNGGDRELWCYDPAGSSAELAADIWTGGSSSPAYLTVFDGSLFFSASAEGSDPISLYRYDGTNVEIVMGTAGVDPMDLRVFQARLYFSGTDASHGRELWFYDGTNSASMVADAIPGTDGVGAGSIFPLNTHLYFRGYDVAYGSELWQFSIQ